MIMFRMKRVLKYLAMALLACGLCSCEVYSDEDYVQEPGYIVAQRVYRVFVNEIFQAAELADFFQQYQSLRGDRDAAVRLAEEYFRINYAENWDERLFYEMAEIPGYGYVYLNEDGTFNVSLYGTSYSSGFTGREYKVSSDAAGHFAITSETPEGQSSPEWSIQAEAACGQEAVVLENCNISCRTEEYSVSAVSVEGDPVQKQKVPVSGFVYQASAGSLHFVYEEPDDEFRDEFDLGFASGYVTVSRGASVLKCEPLDEVNDKTVDYVIEQIN